MARRHHTVTDIVSSVYCEQKLVFDKRYGKARTRDTERKAVAGRFEHQRFEWEGYTRNPARLLAKMAHGKPAWAPRPAVDSRGFIASHVHGRQPPRRRQAFGHEGGASERRFLRRLDRTPHRIDRRPGPPKKKSWREMQELRPRRAVPAALKESTLT